MQCLQQVITSHLKPRGDVTRSPKQGYQWPYKKDYCNTIFYFKKQKKQNKNNKTMNTRVQGERHRFRGRL